MLIGPPIGETHNEGRLRPDGVHHGPHVIHAPLERWHLTHRHTVRQARPALVEQDQPRERHKPVHECAPARVLPPKLYVRDPAGHQHQINRTVPHDLVGDMNIPALGVTSLGRGHPGPPAYRSLPRSFSPSLLGPADCALTNACLAPSSSFWLGKPTNGSDLEPADPQGRRTRFKPASGPCICCIVPPLLRAPRSMVKKPASSKSAIASAFASTSSPERKITRRPPASCGSDASTAAVNVLAAFTTRAGTTRSATSSLEVLPLTPPGSKSLVASITIWPLHSRPSSAC